MTTSPLNLTDQDLDKLQQLRALLLAFQNMIANLDATDQNNEYNEQFNKLRAEAKTILRTSHFDHNVPRAVSVNVVAERTQKANTRLSAILILGVILALLGLGINSIVLEDVLINSLGCLISTGGMLLVIGALVVLTITGTRQQLTNLGDLYIRCDALIQEIDQVLEAAIPGYAQRPVEQVPQIPSAVSLALDSLEKQRLDWEQKLETLREQQRTLGANAPVELVTTMNFVRRELDRIEYHMNNLSSRVEALVSTEPEAGPAEEVTPVAPPAEPEVPPEVAAKASSMTQPMPPVEEPEAPQPPAETVGTEDEIVPDPEEAPSSAEESDKLSSSDQ